MGSYRYLLKILLTRNKLTLAQFNGTFLVNSIPANLKFAKKPFPQKIFSFWTGNNEMSSQRKTAFALLKKNAGVEVVLITPENLNDYILPKYPLHPGFEHLSLVHRSDYLRCYFMHHYGGGYSDIKGTNNNWSQLFNLLSAKEDKWIVGYREIGERGVAPVPGALGLELKKYWHILIGNGAYIFKPSTPFTHEWYIELHNRLDGYLNSLQHNPGNVMGDNPGYPIPWTGILGDIFHPLCLKYFKRLIYSSRIKPILKGYR